MKPNYYIIIIIMFTYTYTKFIESIQLRILMNCIWTKKKTKTTEKKGSIRVYHFKLRFSIIEFHNINRNQYVGQEI